jgi:predicted 3-demethylubiquinone-9 3-methyltransferase (glyoxalase superfamily)
MWYDRIHSPKDVSMPRRKITTFLWYDNDAEEAAKFYTSIFKNSKINRVTRFPEGAPQPAGSVMTVDFELDGVPFIALNGGPMFQFTEAISLSVDCADQAEIDELWDKLTAGGTPSQCGWLKDKFGLSWQIVPSNLEQLLSGNDPVKSKRAVTAMLKMSKLDIDKLQKAYDGLP